MKTQADYAQLDLGGRSQHNAWLLEFDSTEGWRRWEMSQAFRLRITEISEEQ
jgi:hypothetical protein